MKHILLLIIFTLGLTGCVKRKVVISPEDISQKNDVDWHVTKQPTTDDSDFWTEKSIGQDERSERVWELGE